MKKKIIKNRCPVCNKRYIDEYLEEKTGNKVFVHTYNSIHPSLNKFSKYCEIVSIKK